MCYCQSFTGKVRTVSVARMLQHQWAGCTLQVTCNMVATLQKAREWHSPYSYQPRKILQTCLGEKLPSQVLIYAHAAFVEVLAARTVPVSLSYVVLGAGVPYLVSGPHALRKLTVTAVLNGQTQGAPSPADTALLMGKDLNVWLSVYDQGREKRSAAAAAQRAALHHVDWRQTVIAQAKSFQSSKSTVA